MSDKRDNLEKALNDIELDDILSSMKSNSDRLNNLLEEKPFELDSSIEAPAPVENVAPAPVVQEKKKEKKKKEKKPKKTKAKLEIKKPNKAVMKKIGIALIAIALVGAVVFGIWFIQGAKTRPYEKKYGVKFPKGIAEEFYDAYGINPEVVGRLYVPDTNDKPMVSSIYDTKRYPYFEAGSEPYGDQQFRALHLESLDSDLELAYGTAEAYTKSSQKISYKTIFGDETTYQVVAAYYVNTNPQDDNDYCFPYNVYGDLTEDSFDEFEDRVKTRSLYFTDYDLSYNDSFLTLSVDTKFMDGFRFVVLCVEVDEVVPYTTTRENPKIHYPQVWYDTNDQHNPYWLASQWEPEIYADKKHKTIIKPVMQ